MLNLVGRSLATAGTRAVTFTCKTNTCESFVPVFSAGRTYTPVSHKICLAGWRVISITFKNPARWIPWACRALSAFCTFLCPSRIVRLLCCQSLNLILVFVWWRNFKGTSTLLAAGSSAWDGRRWACPTHTTRLETASWLVPCSGPTFSFGPCFRYAHRQTSLDWYLMKDLHPPFRLHSAILRK
jgi:hypothetical protein